MKKNRYLPIFTIILSFLFNMTAFATDNESDFYVRTVGYIPPHIQELIVKDSESASTYSIIGSDNRREWETTAYAAFATAFLDEITYECNHDSGYLYMGTGFMVSANCMLTAAHNLVCDTCGADFDNIIVRFGNHADTDSFQEGFIISQSNEVEEIYICPQYNHAIDNPENDYAYIVFEENIGLTTGWYPLMAATDTFLNQNPNICVSGYEDGILYSANGLIQNKTSTRLYYDADTDHGQSGSPVYISNARYLYDVVAIHTHGIRMADNTDTDNNSGWRITSAFIQTLAQKGYVTIDSNDPNRTLDQG